MNELQGILRHHAAADKVALVAACAGETETAVTYGTLLLHGRRLARALSGRSDRSRPGIVAVLSADPLRQAIAIVAGITGGMIVNAINTALSPAMLHGQLQHAQPDLLIVDDTEQLPEGLPEGIVLAAWDAVFDEAVDDTANDAGNESEGGLLIYTSGTTGLPKGVLLPWSHIAANVRHAIDALGMKPGWTAGSLLPRFHSFTLISDIFPALLLGGHAVLTDSFELSKVNHIVATFKEHGVQSYSAAPTILEAFCAMRAWEGADTLCFAVAGAAPLKNRTRQEYAGVFGHPIIPCYGLTETTCFAAISPPHAIREGAVGLPAGIDVRVLGDNGEHLPADATGELVMRGPSVILGYFRDAAGRFTDAFTDDGWLRTGDIGRIDADGYIYVTGRKKNMVIRGGNKVYLEDVDRCMADLPGIIDCASVVLCRPDLPDEALSFVVHGGEAPSRSVINEHVLRTLSRRHVPDRIFWVDRIPRTRTGKASIPDLLALAREFEVRGETGR